MSFLLVSASKAQSLEEGLTWEVSPTLAQGGHSTPELPEHKNGDGCDGH